MKRAEENAGSPVEFKLGETAGPPRPPKKNSRRFNFHKNQWEDVGVDEEDNNFPRPWPSLCTGHALLWALLLFCVVCAIPLVCTACYWCSKKGKNPIGEETPLASSLSDSVEALGNYSKQILATEPAVKVREDYFDNLKVFLTVVVVMHHTVCAFVGTSWFYAIGQFDGNSFKSFGFATLLLNQSYFMSLFFLISGYFIPPSYDKKGSCGSICFHA